MTKGSRSRTENTVKRKNVMKITVLLAFSTNENVARRKEDSGKEENLYFQDTSREVGMLGVDWKDARSSLVFQ